MSKKEKHIISCLIITLAIIILSLFLFSFSMAKPVGHDEHMYCTAGYMMAQGKLVYRDFTYVAQMPYHPLLLGAIYKITSTENYLFTARVVSVIFEAGILICLAGIYKMAIKESLFYGTSLGISAMILYCFNVLVLYAAGYAWNHSMTIFCIILSLWLFLSMDFSKICKVRLIISGIVLCIATFTRPTTIFVLLLFVLAIYFMADRKNGNKIRCTLFFLTGVIVGAVWPVLVIFRSPRAFFLNTIKIPALNAEFLQKIQMVFDKTELSLSSLKTPSYLFILFILVFILISILTQRKHIEPWIKKRTLFCFILTAVMFFIVFIPPTMWVQYWAIPVCFILVSFCFPLHAFNQFGTNKQNKSILFRIACYLIIASIIINIIPQIAMIKVSFGNLLNINDWAPVQIHNIAKDIVSKSGDKPILTMSPLYAIEGGGEIYTEFSAGPFVYRIADKLSDEQKKLISAAGFSDMEEFIKNENPNAIILGTEPDILEEPIKKCLNNQWSVKGYGENGPIVYFK